MPSLPLKVLAAAVGIVVAAAAQAEAAPRKAKKKAAVAAATTTNVPARYKNGSVYPKGPVYNGNDYIGDDPDPFIRFQLFRDMSRYGGDP